MFFYESIEKEVLPKEKLGDEEYIKNVKKYLKEFDLWDKRIESPQTLSGGEKQRLSIIIALLKDSKFIILDEPTAGLDFKRMNKISEAIKEKSKEKPFILVTHDLELLFKVANTVLLIDKNGYKKIKVRGNENLIRDFLNKRASKNGL